MGEPAFRNERELQAVLSNHAEMLGVNGAEVRTRREMTMGSVIPDLLLVSFDQVPAQSILRVRWSYPQAFVVAELRRFPTLRRRTLAERMFDQLDRVNPMLDELLDAGALERVGTDSLRLSDELRSLRTQVVAVEAKLARWTEALTQATSYCSFADRSFVALDAGRVDSESVAMTTAFRRAGIGLVLIDGSGARCMNDARTNSRPSAGKEYVRLSSLSSRSQTRWIRR